MLHVVKQVARGVKQMDTWQIVRLHDVPVQAPTFVPKTENLLIFCFVPVLWKALAVIPDTGIIASLPSKNVLCSCRVNCHTADKLLRCGGDGRVAFWDPQLGSVEAPARPSHHRCWCCTMQAKLLRTYEQPEEFRTLSYVNLPATQA